MLHTAMAGESARQQIAILKQEGVKMGRVKIDHANDTNRFEIPDLDFRPGLFPGTGPLSGQSHYPRGTHQLPESPD